MWNTAFSFSNKCDGQKKVFIEKKSFFAVDSVKIIELLIVHAWRHMQSEMK